MGDDFFLHLFVIWLDFFFFSLQAKQRWNKGRKQVQLDNNLLSIHIAEEISIPIYIKYARIVILYIARLYKINRRNILSQECTLLLYKTKMY